MPRLARAVTFVLLTFAFLMPAAAQDKKEPPKLSLSQEEQTLLDLTNAERAKEKLPPLSANRLLFNAARGHSANMAKKGEMKHDLDGKSAADRVTAEGYDWMHTGENIASGQGWSLEAVVKSWMESPGHRANILKKEYEEIGLGVARAANGDRYYTQVFGKAFKPRK